MLVYLTQMKMQNAASDQEKSLTKPHCSLIM